MRFRHTLLLLASVVLAGALAAVAVAATRTVPAKDPSPTITTPPTLVSRSDVVKVSEKSPGGSAPVRLKVYPSTYGFKPVNSSCQGKFLTKRQRPGSSGKVVIRLKPKKPLCRGIIYQAEALIGTGDVPDKFAHICVRGHETTATSGCEDSLDQG